MLFWHVGGAVLLFRVLFKDLGVDLRFLTAGALLLDAMWLWREVLLWPPAGGGFLTAAPETGPAFPPMEDRRYHNLVVKVIQHH